VCTLRSGVCFRNVFHNVRWVRIHPWCRATGPRPAWQGWPVPRAAGELGSPVRCCAAVGRTPFACQLDGEHGAWRGSCLEACSSGVPAAPQQGLGRVCVPRSQPSSGGWWALGPRSRGSSRCEVRLVAGVGRHATAGRSRLLTWLGNESSSAPGERRGLVPEQTETRRWFRLASASAATRWRNPACSLLSGAVFPPRRRLGVRLRGPGALRHVRCHAGPRLPGGCSVSCGLCRVWGGGINPSCLLSLCQWCRPRSVQSVSRCGVRLPRKQALLGLGEASLLPVGWLQPAAPSCWGSHGCRNREAAV